MLIQHCIHEYIITDRIELVPEGTNREDGGSQGRRMTRAIELMFADNGKYTVHIPSDVPASVIIYSLPTAYAMLYHRS